MTISKYPLPWGVKAFNKRGNIVSEIYLTADGEYAVHRLETLNGLDLGWEVLKSSNRGWLVPYNTSASIAQIADDFGWELNF